MDRESVAKEISKHLRVDKISKDDIAKFNDVLNPWVIIEDILTIKITLEGLVSRHISEIEKAKRDTVIETCDAIINNIDADALDDMYDTAIDICNELKQQTKEQENGY